MLFTLLCVSLIQQVRGAWDPTLTVISRWGYLEGPEVTTSIRCMSMYHPIEKLEFSRVLNTGQDAQLPTNKLIEIDDNGPSKVLKIPPSNDQHKDRRFGVFSCRVTAHNVTTEVITLKQPSPETAEVAAVSVYIRSHIGQSISLPMVKIGNGEEARLVWRHKGIRFNAGNDKENLEISPVSLKDAGIYEAFYENRRKFGRHAMTRLVVTECPANRFGSNCDLVCPICINGGICHEVSGQCICPPGFGGDHCQYSCGFNKLGPTCSWECDANNAGCERYLICLPDPYSCSCAAGFMGSDCDQQCPDGRFGANCAQECNCRNVDDICDKVTGACPRGCRDTFQGESCQVPELDSVLKNSLRLWKTSSPNRVRVTWSQSQSMQGNVMYTVEYRLQKKEKCESKTSVRPSWRQVTTSSLEVSLDQLDSYSVYEFAITANSSLGFGKSDGGTFVTDAGIPKGSPKDVALENVGSDSALLNWNPIDCSESEGNIIAYESELWLLPDSGRGFLELNEPTSNTWDALEKSRVIPTRINTTGTNVRVTGLGAYHHYGFRVRGWTNKGAGPWSDGVVFMTEYIVAPPPQVMLIEKSAHTLSIGVASMELPPELLRRVNLELRAESVDSAGISEVNLEANPDFVVHNHTFTKLLPFTAYFVRARVTTDGGFGNWSSFLAVITDETYPSTPSVTLLRPGSSHLHLTLHPPINANGVLIKYRIRVAGPRNKGITPAMPVIPVPPSGPVLNYTVKHLEPASRYTIHVQAATNIGWGNWSSVYEAWTTEDVPEPPTSLNLLHANGTHLQVKWTPPAKTYGDVTSYELICEPLMSLNSSLVMSELALQTLKLGGNVQEFVISTLEPLTKYTVQVRAINNKFQGVPIMKIFMTGLPPPIPLECFPDSVTDTKIPVHLTAMDLPSELTILYQVIVEDGDKEVWFDEDRLTDYETSKDLELDYYVAFEVDANKMTAYGLLIYIGDDRKYGDYWNAPLMAEKLYRFRLRVIATYGQVNYTSYTLKTIEAKTEATQPIAERSVESCQIYDPQCFWFPFTIVGFSICVIWIVVSIIMYKYCLTKPTKQNQYPPEKEQGSSTSFAWSVGYRKGLTSHSEASTLVKDHNTLL